MKKVIVIGSGAGGATIAKELQGKFNVTIIEEGMDFKPFAYNLEIFANLRKTGMLFDEKFIQIPFPVMRIRKTEDKMVLVNGVAFGGTTTISAGNARRVDDDLKKIGINLDREFLELYNEIPVKTDHQKKWSNASKTLFKICKSAGLDPVPTPKMGDYEKCTGCGMCVLGCTKNVKWDSRKFLKIASGNGSTVIKGCRALNLKFDLVQKKNKVTGVYAKSGL
jgi:choline dehydrogenase-like flavoprotein